MEGDIISKILGSWAKDINVYSSILRIFLSVLFAVVIGCERATKRHAAGVRTFMLVSIAATIASIADGYFINNKGVGIPFLSTAIIIGLAIISCNTILFSSKNQLKGLTTSVCLWANGVNAILIGFGFYFVGLIIFLIQIISILILPKIESIFKKRSNMIETHIELKSKNSLQEFITAIRKFGISILNIESNPAYVNSGLGVYSMLLALNSEELKTKTHKEIIEILSSLDCICFIEEID